MTEFDTLPHDAQMAILLEVAQASLSRYDLPAGTGVALLNLSRLAPERALYGKYMERVAHLRKEPPEADWKGVWKFETK